MLEEFDVLDGGDSEDLALSLRKAASNDDTELVVEEVVVDDDESYYYEEVTVEDEESLHDWESEDEDESSVHQFFETDYWTPIKAEDSASTLLTESTVSLTSRGLSEDSSSIWNEIFSLCLSPSSLAMRPKSFTTEANKNGPVLSTVSSADECSEDDQEFGKY